MTIVLVLVLMGAVAWLAADHYDGWEAMVLALLGMALFAVAAVRFGVSMDAMADASPVGRADNARATIAAATAAVASGTAESELAALERAASVAATAAASEGER